jgi:hypothetical protein
MCELLRAANKAEGQLSHPCARRDTPNPRGLVSPPSREPADGRQGQHGG